MPGQDNQQKKDEMSRKVTAAGAAAAAPVPPPPPEGLPPPPPPPPDPLLALPPPPPPEQAAQGDPPSVVTQPCPLMKKKYPTDVPRILEIGFFFDGTGNNRENSRQKGKNWVNKGGFDPAYGSFRNDESNVALLYEFYKTEKETDKKHQRLITRKSVYKEGIGTQAGWADVAMGTTRGTGGTGVHARVHGALKKLKALVGRPDNWDDIIIDVFGFSRGAAAARYFVNCVNAGKVGWTISGGRHFNPVSNIPACRVRFLGVFDTVAAIGYWGNDGDISDEKTDQVNVNLSSNSADKIVHLIAEHEYRHGFSLNQINGSRGEEIELPGSHSDVGGGYSAAAGIEPMTVAMPRESYSMSLEEVRQQGAEETQKLHVLRRRFADIGWVSEGDALEKIRLVDSGKAGSIKWKVMCTRLELKPRFNTVALAIMWDRAIAAGVPFKDFERGDERTAIPEDLLGVYGAFGEAQSALAPEAKRAAMRKYGHISAQYDDCLPGAGYFMGEAAGAVRTKHLNEPTKAKPQRQVVGRKQP